MICECGKELEASVIAQGRKKCITCRRKYHRDRCKDPAIRKAAYLAVKAFKQRIHDYITIRKAGPCADCGNSFPGCVMDFDHRDPATKTHCVSAMIRLASTREEIDSEIAKCDLVCANCHRIRTFKRRQ